MTKICTDIEQSNRLIELKIDANSSDCSWILSPRDGHYILSLTAPLDDDIPAWSLSALLELILKANGKKTFYSDENPLDDAFETVCWLKENNKL